MLPSPHPLPFPPSWPDGPLVGFPDPRGLPDDVDVVALAAVFAPEALLGAYLRGIFPWPADDEAGFLLKGVCGGYHDDVLAGYAFRHLDHADPSPIYGAAVVGMCGAALTGDGEGNPSGAEYFLWKQCASEAAQVDEPALAALHPLEPDGRIAPEERIAGGPKDGDHTFTDSHGSVSTSARDDADRTDAHARGLEQRIAGPKAHRVARRGDQEQLLDEAAEVAVHEARAVREIGRAHV